MEIEKEIIKLSSCQRYLLIQSFRTMINIIDLENYKQKQVNFKTAEISLLDYYDELIILTKDGKLYYKNEIIQLHSGCFISAVVKDGMILTLGQDGILKQTNIKTLQCLYSRQLNDNITNGSLYILQQHILVHYGQKVILLNLENDVIETKYKINQQGPLLLKLNNLSKEYFSILGKEGLLKIYNINNIEPIQSIELSQYNNYELYYLPKKTTILIYEQDILQSYLFEQTLIKQFEIKINNLQTIIQGTKLLIIYDNISNPKLKQIYNIQGQKFKSLYQQEQLLKFNELQDQQQQQQNKQNNKNQQISVAFYDFAYYNSEKNQNQNIEPQKPKSEQNMINVLKQALIAKDKIILEYAIERTLINGVQESVNALILEQLQELQNYIIDKLISYPEQTKKYLPWIKSIVNRGIGDFSKLYYLLEERTKNINQLEKVCAKIQFNKLTQKPKKENDYRKQQHIIYEEQQTEVVVIDGNLQRKQQNIDDNEIEEQTSQVDDEFNKAYNKHQQDLRRQAYQEIEEEQFEEGDLQI